MRKEYEIKQNAARHAEAFMGEESINWIFGASLRSARHGYEKGRSLVETLATLSIMGILAVIGIAAFNKAMDKNKANTLIQEAQRRAVIVAGQIGFKGNTPSLAEFEPYKNTSAGTFDSKVYYNEGGLYKQFGIKVEGVEKNVCQNVLNTIGEATPIRRLSKEGALTTPITTCDDNKSAYIIIYNEDMTAEQGDTKYCSAHTECEPECGTCKKESGADKGVCVVECNRTCEMGDTCGDNECVVCDEETKTCQNQCEEVEYLESNGSQYIDTGILATKKTEFELSCYYKNVTASSAGECIFGMRYKRGADRWIFQVSNYPTEYTQNYGFAAFGDSVNELLQSTENGIHDYTFSYKNGIFSNGHNITLPVDLSDDIIPINPIPSNWTLYIFRGNYVSEGHYDGAIGKIYYLKLWDNGTLVCDFIPVLSPQSSKCTGKPSMFDKVSKKLFCNSGSGDFIAGPPKSN